MREKGIWVNVLFERHLFFFMLLASLAGWRGAETLAGARQAVPLLFAYMTLTASLKCSWRDIARVAVAPGPLVLILVLLHVVIPAGTALVGRWFPSASPEVFSGYLLIGAVPIGVTSAIWASLAGGDVPLALTAATLDTLLAPLIVPLVISTFLGQHLEVDLGSLCFSLLGMLVVPAAVGLTICDLTRGSAHSRWGPYLGPFSHLALLTVIAINVATVRHALDARDLGIGLLMLGSLLLVLSNYALGFAGAWLFRLDRPTSTTVVYSVGLRNLSAGLVIAMGHFPAATGIPVVLAMLFQQPCAALLQGPLRPPGPHPPDPHSQPFPKGEGAQGPRPLGILPKGEGGRSSPSEGSQAEEEG